MRTRFSQLAGFTMIELLVVIAVIGILAVATLSAINPIEQINKGKDTRVRSDAAELINSSDRYYSIHETYPWNDVASGTPAYTPPAALSGNPDVEFSFDGRASTAGIWNWTSNLVSTAEIKQGFANRLDTNRDLYVYKAAGSNATMYVCFLPASQAFRLEAAKGCNSTTGTASTVSVTIDGTTNYFCATTNGTVPAVTAARQNWICLP